MKKLIGVNLAGKILLFFMILLAIFHVLILLKVLPSEIVWGGQMRESSTNMVTLEIIALFITLIFTLIIAAKRGYIRVGKFEKLINVGMWIIFAYFILNTIGNLTSAVFIEKLIFSPITLLMSFFAFILATEK
jgi:hypothetical protein